METIPNKSSDAGPEDRSASMDARDYIDLAIEALELAKYSADGDSRRDWLDQAEGYMQSAQQKLKEGK